MPNRLLKNWIDSYLEYTSFQESPNVFHYWDAISVLSASMERSCWVDYGYFKLFPNQYIILIGASAEVRKSSAIGIARRLYMEAFPKGRMFAQKITQQAFIKFMNDGYKEKKISGGYIVADELAFFFGDSIHDTGVIQLLTKIYTCEDQMDYETIARGREVAHNSYCSLLGGTTPEWVRESFPGHAIEGGFAGRILFVYAAKTDEGRRFPPLSLNPQKNHILSVITPLKEKLIIDLRAIGELKGEFKFTPEGQAAYNEWYMNVYNPSGKHVDLKGYYGRKHDMVLKLCMVFSASEGDDLTITPVHVERAVKQLGKLENELPLIMALIQASPTGHQQHKIVQIISATELKKMSRVNLMRRLSYSMSARELDDMLTTLLQSKQLVQMIDPDKNNAIWYGIPVGNKSIFEAPK